MSVRLRRRSIFAGQSYYWLQAPSTGTWGYPVVHDDRWIYAVPVGGTNYVILKIDTQTDTITEFSTGETDVYLSAAVTGDTLYATPASGDQILSVDLTTDTPTTITAPSSDVKRHLVTAPNGDVWGFPSASSVNMLKISGGVASSVSVTGTNFQSGAATLSGTDIYAVCSDGVSSNPGVIRVDTLTSTTSRITPTGGTGNCFYGAIVPVGSDLYALPRPGTTDPLNGAMLISAGVATIDSYDYASSSSFTWAVEVNGDVWSAASDGDSKAVQVDVSAGTFDEVGSLSVPSTGGVVIQGRVWITSASTRDLQVVNPAGPTVSVFASAAVPSWAVGGTSGAFHPIAVNGKLYAFTQAGNSVRRLKL